MNKEFIKAKFFGAKFDCQVFPKKPELGENDAPYGEEIVEIFDVTACADYDCCDKFGNHLGVFEFYELRVFEKDYFKRQVEFEIADEEDRDDYYYTMYCAVRIDNDEE